MVATKKGTFMATVNINSHDQSTVNVDARTNSEQKRIARVLVIDRNGMMGNLVKTLVSLIFVDANVDHHWDAVASERYVSFIKYDLIITEYTLESNGDAIEMIKRMKQSSYNGHVPDFVIMSNDENAKEAAIKIGARFLAKDKDNTFNTIEFAELLKGLAARSG